MVVICFILLFQNMEAEKQVKFFHGCVAAAFAERDHSIMEVMTVFTFKFEFIVCLFLVRCFSFILFVYMGCAPVALNKFWLLINKTKRKKVWVYCMILCESFPAFNNCRSFWRFFTGGFRLRRLRRRRRLCRWNWVISRKGICQSFNRLGVHSLFVLTVLNRKQNWLWCQHRRFFCYHIYL